MKIALIAKMRSGKDTVADYLCEQYGFDKYAFGDELKRYYHELFGETEAKPREGYQWFGQTLRQRDRDIWVRKCFENIDKFDPIHIVVSDLRQPNEYKKCKAEGYTIVKIECDDELRVKRIMQKNDQFNMSNLKHDTEMHIDKFNYDYMINNNGSLEDLYKQVDSLIQYVVEYEK
ncbi:adenylate kinase [uncultured Metabacillus sp.]|uniref:deoxynucleotide monophosphate kinase family protein n=1 Tax=uncultured Metabacillus sp. TaxID=2860135 RepID=UPI00260C01C8|nr:adenylate kinase [uncultured Metabacillus sp.]